MSYRSFLGADLFEVGYFTNSEVHHAVVRIGERDNPTRTYSIVCSLMPIAIGPPHAQEFAFCLLEVEQGSGVEYRWWDGRDTKTVIQSKQDRERCVGVIATCLETLLAEVHPKDIFMQACSSDLPDRAMVKYHRILETFGELGYCTTEAPEYHGRRSWWMERLDA